MKRKPTEDNGEQNNREDPELLDLVSVRMDKRLREIAGMSGPEEARHLIRNYYEFQIWRIGFDHQLRKLKENNDHHDVLKWQRDCAERLELQTAVGIAEFAKKQPMGRWALANKGIGPISAAALCAHIDLDKMSGPTAGAIWAFAGLDPSRKWEKGEKRPWNAQLKTACWKIGQSFIKVSNKDGAHYGKYFKDRKEYRVQANTDGRYSERAKTESERFTKAHDCWWWNKGYLTGEEFRSFLAMNAAERAKFMTQVHTRKKADGIPMLSPGHINAMAARDAVKLFLSHWFEVAYELKHGEKPPKPFAIAIQGHAHYMPPFVGKEAAED